MARGLSVPHHQGSVHSLIGCLYIQFIQAKFPGDTVEHLPGTTIKILLVLLNLPVVLLVFICQGRPRLRLYKWFNICVWLNFYTAWCTQYCNNTCMRKECCLPRPIISMQKKWNMFNIINKLISGVWLSKAGELIPRYLSSLPKAIDVLFSPIVIFYISRSF